MRPCALTRVTKMIQRVGSSSIAPAARPVPDSSCLFVCDMQETFRKHMTEFPAVATNIEFAMRAFNLLGSDIFVSEQKPFAPTINELRCLYDTTVTVEGSAPLEKPNVTAYTKTSFSMLPEMPKPVPAGGTAAPAATSVVDSSTADVAAGTGDAYHDVFVVGIESHVCVMQTVLDLLSPTPSLPVADAANAGRTPRVWVLSDAVTSIRTSPSEKDTALAFMRSLGANVISTEAAMFMLMGTSARPEFKPYLELVKRKNKGLEAKM